MSYPSGIAFALGNSASGVFSPVSNGDLNIDWAGTSTDLSIVFGGVTTVIATGAAAPNNTKRYVLPMLGGQSVTITTGAAMTCLVSSKQRVV